MGRLNNGYFDKKMVRSSVNKWCENQLRKLEKLMSIFFVSSKPASSKKKKQYVEYLGSDLKSISKIFEVKIIAFSALSRF